MLGRVYREGGVVGRGVEAGVRVSGDFSASEQRLGQWQQRIEQRAQRYEQARERVERIRVIETSRDGAIAVTVGSNGLLLDLQISDRTPLPPSGIGAEVMGCLRRAQAKLPDLVGEAMAETVGEDTASAHRRRNYSQRCGRASRPHPWLRVSPGSADPRRCSWAS